MSATGPAGVYTRMDLPSLKPARLVLIGRAFFALALIGLGTEHFIFREFVTGRAPAWPAGAPVWPYVTGVLIITIGVALLLDRQARIAALVAAVMILVWALLRQIPVVAGTGFLAGEWTTTGKALVFTGGSLTVAAAVATQGGRADTLLRKLLAREAISAQIGRSCLGLFLVLTGAQHFRYAQFVATLFPQWFPGDPIFWTYAAGVALITGGLGLFFRKTAGTAALLAGGMIFSWVWIIHLPRVFVSQSDSIAVFEALGFSGLLLLTSGLLRRPRNTPGDVEVT